MAAKQSLIKIHQFFANQLGFDPHCFLRSLYGAPYFFRDWLKFRKSYFGTLSLMPCLYDRYQEGGTTRSEYFWQDLLVAKWVFESQPERHVDIGSRVDGFVAHVASFRKIEVLDIRPITTDIPNVIFRHADLMQKTNMSKLEEGYCDSLSCLHSLEHFGLGRYGDPIDPFGHEKGITNMAALLKQGGTFYLSTPIGQERVEFNANRVFDPRSIIQLAKINGMSLKKLIVVGSGGQAVSEMNAKAETLQYLADAEYNLGIFTFIKT